jgi:phosphoglycolate/pyridoxal phosphate phosphatase family enzyme
LRELAAAIDRLSAFIFDMDGVLYIGEAPVKGAAEAIASLRKKGKKLAFVTNKSTSTRREYVRKFARMGIAARESEIVTSAYATSLYLRRRAPGARVYVIGEPGLKRELKRAGLKLLPDTNAKKADFVVAGMDRTITYKKITAALRALLAGADLIATNPDGAYPTETGISPGAGATVGALVGSSGKQPKVVIGKPSTHMIKISLEVFGSKPADTAIVGDKLDTDVLAGKRVGLTTILVLTGVSSRRDAKRARGTKVAPDFVVESIKDLVI